MVVFDILIVVRVASFRKDSAVESVTFDRSRGGKWLEVISGDTELRYVNTAPWLSGSPPTRKWNPALPTELRLALFFLVLSFCFVIHTIVFNGLGL